MNPLILQIFRKASRSLAHFLSLSSVCTFTPLDLGLETVNRYQDIKRFSSVIHDKYILKKTRNGSLIVLDLIDLGALESDARFYNQLLKRCTNLGMLEEGNMVHNHFLASKFHNYVVLRNTVVNMYAKCGDMSMARKAFDEMLERDMVSYTVLVSGYTQNAEPEKALGLFLEMVRTGLKPNQFTFGSVLKASGGLLSDGVGRGIHAACVKCGFEDNVYVGSALIDFYTKYGGMESAEVLFEGLKSKNEVSWNALIAGYARKGEGHNAVKLFSDMKRGGFEPSHFTFSSVFSVCASTGALEQGKWAHAELLKLGLKLVAFVGNTLLDMYGKAGSIEDAKKVFHQLEKKDVVSWNSILTVHAHHGLGKDTLAHFEDMRGRGFQPNEISFLCVLNACSHSGLVNQGLHYFELMKEYNIEPDISHHVAIVDLMGRAGQLDHAVRFVMKMAVEYNAAVWKALLGACRTHKNMELGLYAAERVFELDPHDSGPHILLSNIYASAGRLRDAARVRQMMNDNRVKKEPACSWVEIENAVHMFMANDDTHPQRVEIRLMWEQIAHEIKKIGYVPDTSHVLWFVDQRDREERLQYHSEKIALAFALLNTPPGSPIRIKKNIRVCGDCHTAFKFASKVIDREIILRDTHRFHRFYAGNCSCLDYW